MTASRTDTGAPVKLPDFIIVGAMRSGTSVMCQLLGEHPQLFLAPRELHFFNRHWNRGLAWYMQNFRTKKLAGEKTPAYLSTPRALVRLHQVVPAAKIIVQLRDPCLRLSSHFRHINRRRAAGERWKNVREFLQSRESDDALWRGMYAAQLETLFQLFPRRRVLVVFNEQMRADTAHTCMQVQSFLGVTPRPLANQPSAESHLHGPAVRRRLVEFYREPNRALYRLLGDPHILTWTGMEDEGD